MARHGDVPGRRGLKFGEASPSGLATASPRPENSRRGAVARVVAIVAGVAHGNAAPLRGRRGAAWGEVPAMTDFRA